MFLYLVRGVVVGWTCGDRMRWGGDLGGSVFFSLYLFVVWFFVAGVGGVQGGRLRLRFFDTGIAMGCVGYNIIVIGMRMRDASSTF